MGREEEVTCSKQDGSLRRKTIRLKIKSNVEEIIMEGMG